MRLLGCFPVPEVLRIHSSRGKRLWGSCPAPLFHSRICSKEDGNLRSWAITWSWETDKITRVLDRCIGLMRGHKLEFKANLGGGSQTTHHNGRWDPEPEIGQHSQLLKSASDQGSLGLGYPLLLNWLSEQTVLEKKKIRVLNCHATLHT